jgi:hypothetical protein
MCDIVTAKTRAAQARPRARADARGYGQMSTMHKTVSCVPRMAAFVRSTDGKALFALTQQL